ncbi:MAG: hypothetical protein ACOH2H_16690 [Cypionkella sp.]
MPLIARLAAALALTLLAACQMQTPKTDAPRPVGSLAPDAITVTTLDSAAVAAAPIAPAAEATGTAAAPMVQVPDKTTPRPKPSLAKLSPALPETTALAPAPQIPPEQALCEKSGGEWSALGASSGRICVHRTRDAGKSCHRKSDCQGECLAQSGTCSPITPLMGCNDILQANGTRVTLCLQ